MPQRLSVESTDTTVVNHYLLYMRPETHLIRSDYDERSLRVNVNHTRINAIEFTKCNACHGYEGHRPGSK